MASMSEDLAQLARLALSGREADVRMYLSRISRRYRDSDPALAQSIAELLSRPPAARSNRTTHGDSEVLDGDEGRSSVLRSAQVLLEAPMKRPVLSATLQLEIEQLLLERDRADELLGHGLRPASSAIFVGPPGVGKTITAQWLAQELHLPLLTLDLTTVMSSRLGQSGANLRLALDTARAQPSVLFLDEIDAIAKRRDDDGDVGELKRLVTILLQEIDDWPSSSLLLGATNHADLVDPALWRRFDMRLSFEAPAGQQLEEAVVRYLDGDTALSEHTDFFTTVYEGMSFSEIRRNLLSLRKLHLLGQRSTDDIMKLALESSTAKLTSLERADLANLLVERTTLSKRKASALMHVGRDTMRKHEPKHD